jgi:hypothetical protein
MTTQTADWSDVRFVNAVVARTGDAESLERFRIQGDGCGWCTNPIRLKGTQTRVNRSTGEIVGTYSTDSEPDGVLLKSCGTRRATRCPSCAATYAADARMVVRSGLIGGKGVSSSVSNHPLVFATFTAPSFGTVHGTRSGRSQTCRPRDPGQRCPHGRPLSCWAHHDAGDPKLGQPLCPDCYDYERAVLWNATCPELWRRTTIYLFRELARLSGTNAAGLRKVIRLSFAKVAEYQQRGVVHLHAVIRIDPVGDRDVGNATLCTTATLTAAIRLAVTKVSAPLPDGFSGSVRWGDQVDVKTVTDSDEHRGIAPVVTSARAVANYVAKYATKSTDTAGALDRRLRGIEDLDIRGVIGHLRRLVETAWKLGERSNLSRLRAWAHTLGFGGHWLTKSRRYSVTMGYLRAERQACQVLRQSAPKVVTGDVVTVSEWQWVGIGWSTHGDAWLAGVEQRAMSQARTDARDALCIEKAMGIDTARRDVDQFLTGSSDHWERGDRRVGS